MNDKISKQLLSEFMSSFLGYGNLTSPYWFIGKEEGGGASLEENFQDTLVDGIHPDDAGHALLFQKIVRFLEQKNLLPVAQ